MNMCGGGDGLGAPGFSVSRGAPDSQDGGEVSDLFSRFCFVQRGLRYFLENIQSTKWFDLFWDIWLEGGGVVRSCHQSH